MINESFMYLSDIEGHFIINGFKGVDIGMLKLFVLLYADDIVILSETENGFQHGLKFLEDYCDRWKLQVNVNKRKVMIFRNRGAVRKKYIFYLPK